MSKFWRSCLWYPDFLSRHSNVTSFKCLKFVKSFAVTYSSHSLVVIAKNPSESDYFSKKTQTIDLKTWKWLWVEVITCGISWTELERAWNWQRQSNKNSHSLGVAFFDNGIFKGCYTLLWNYTCNELRFFQNFQGKPGNVIGVFTKAFLQPPCLFFFWNRPLIDR